MAATATISVSGTRAKKVPALTRLRMANAERHAEPDPTGHWLQEEGAVSRHFEELLSSSAATDPRRTYARDHLASTRGVSVEDRCAALRPAGRGSCAKDL